MPTYDPFPHNATQRTCALFVVTLAVCDGAMTLEYYVLTHEWCCTIQKLLRAYFPSLYTLLTNRRPGEKSKGKDEAKKILRDANIVLANASRERVIGHLTFSDWKAFAQSNIRVDTSDEPKQPAQKKQKTLESPSKPVTSRFRQNTEDSTRSAQVR